MTEAGIERAQADALADAIRQAAEHGDHVTAEQLRIEIRRVIVTHSRHGRHCVTIMEWDDHDYMQPMRIASARIGTGGAVRLRGRGY